MAKGFFTQGVCLLTDGTTTIDHVKAALRAGGFEVAKELPGNESWAFGGPAVVVPFLPAVNGYLSVDVVDRPWPDSMGDPKSDPMTFGAWSMGYFGPLAFPGGLARAAQHAWAWQPAQTIADGHRGFVRLRLSYAFGAADSATVIPKDYDPLAEMMFVSRVAIALLAAPGVTCYFNPNGEVLRDRTAFLQFWEPCTAQGKIPLQLWSNIRFFNLGGDLGFMDTVGNGQLDVRDVEAAFPMSDYDPGNVDYDLSNVSHYLLGLDREMTSGESIDGPGETNLSWTIDVLDQSVAEPPRRVLRLYPKANAKAVRKALSAAGG